MKTTRKDLFKSAIGFIVRTRVDYLYALWQRLILICFAVELSRGSIYVVSSLTLVSLCYSISRVKLVGAESQITVLLQHMPRDLQRSKPLRRDLCTAPHEPRRVRSRPFRGYQLMVSGKRLVDLAVSSYQCIYIKQPFFSSTFERLFNIFSCGCFAFSTYYQWLYHIGYRTANGNRWSVHSNLGPEMLYYLLYIVILY